MIGPTRTVAPHRSTSTPPEWKYPKSMTRLPKITKQTHFHAGLTGGGEAVHQRPARRTRLPFICLIRLSDSVIQSARGSRTNSSTYAETTQSYPQ